MRASRNRLAKARPCVSLIETLLVVLILSATAAVAIFNVSSIKTVDPSRQSAQSFVATGSVYGPGSS